MLDALAIEDLSRVCRFCLQQSLEMRPIFRHESADEVKYLVCDGEGSAVSSNEEIVEMISICIGLEVKIAN